MTTVNPEKLVQLKESEELFNALVENMLDGVAIVDWDGTIQFVNNAAARMLGLESREDAVGRRPSEFLHPDSIARAQREMGMVKEGRADFLSDYQLLIDGNIIDIESHGAEVQYRGHSADMVVFRDVTERERQKAELLRLNETLETRIAERTRELKKGERMFRAMTESMNAMVVIADVSEGRAVYVNPMATTITGYAEEEMLGKVPVNLFSEESMKEVLQYQNAWLAGEDVPRVTCLEILTRSGERRWIETAWTIIDLEEDGLHKVTVSFDVTERKNAERQLAESEKKFRALAESTTAMITISAPTENGFEIVYANDAALNTLGYTWEEFRKLSPLSLIDMEDESQRKLVEDLLKVHSEQPVPSVNVEVKVVTKSGDRRWIAHTGTHVELEGRICDVSTSFDITERKRAEAQLIESEKKFRALAESTSARICITAEDNGYVKFLYANRALLDYIGTTWEELTAQDPMLFCGNDDDNSDEEVVPKGQKEWMDAAREARTRGISNYSYEFVDEFGAWIQMHAMETVLDGKNCTIWTSFDISEQKRTQAALQESEERYRTIFETTGTGMIIFDDEAMVLLANEEWARLVGYPLEDIQGKMRVMDFIAREKLAEIEENHRKRSMDPESVPRTYETLLQDKSGKVHVGIATIAMIPGTRMRVASFQDLSELKRAQKQMYQADKMAALGQIIAGVAHEINNPNNFIYFNLPILRRYLDAVKILLDEHVDDAAELKILGMVYEAFWEDTYKLLENMEHGSSRITSIVADLKNYVRSDEDADMKPESLKPVVDRVMTLVGKQVRKMVKHFDVETDDQLPEIIMNAGKIEQVLINLLINAGQAADKPDSFVNLKIHAVGSHVKIEVSDNGTGIPDDYLEQIFEPFFTSKGRDAGTGLGLSISHKIVEDHGGTISVETEPGKGSRFTVLLPTDSPAVSK